MINRWVIFSTGRKGMLPLKQYFAFKYKIYPPSKPEKLDNVQSWKGTRGATFLDAIILKQKVLHPTLQKGPKVCWTSLT